MLPYHCPSEKEPLFLDSRLMLSHFVFSRALAHERLMWSARCWKPRIRQRTSKCVFRSQSQGAALRIHVTRPYNMVSIASAYSRRTFRLSRAVVILCSSGPNRSKHALMSPTRRLISTRRPAYPWTTPPRYSNYNVCLYL